MTAHSRQNGSIKAALQLKVGMVGRDSQLASRPEPIAIGFKEDRPPRVTLTHSGVGARITPSAMIPFKVAVRDDFAVARTALDVQNRPQYGGRRGGSRGAAAKSLRISRLWSFSTARQGPLEPTFDGEHEWDLESLKLVPGDTVSATAEATDDCYTGPQTSRSRTLTFRVVSRNELFREILLKQQQLRARLRKATEQAELLRQSIVVGLSAGRRRGAVAAAQPDSTRSLAGDARHRRLGDGNAAQPPGGAETHEIINRTVIAPLERLHDDLLTRQRQGLESVKQPGADTQEQLASREHEIVETMSKILKSMSQWDSFIDVVNQLTEVINLENLVRNKTEDLKKKQFDSIFDSK